VRGRIVPLEVSPAESPFAASQFEISDSRSPEEIAAVLRRNGIEPVWKDWDVALTQR
jgi:2-iminoacetate synthase